METQAFVAQEIDRPSKTWVREVISAERESEQVRVRTPDFVLLPDQQRRRPSLLPVRWKDGDRCLKPHRRLDALASALSFRRVNWLAITTDPTLRSIRDLRARHVPMLERMQRLCVAAMQRELGVEEDQIMIFANYPPSVYQLHFHFTVPFMQPSPYDAFRVHPLSTILNNLQLCPEYYRESTFRIPVHAASDLYAALCPDLASSSEDDERIA
jgi:m7GpppX diphosphatase